MSLEIDENAAVYETVKKRSIPLRKIISGDYRVDGSRGDGTPPWAVRRAAPTRIRHAGRVYVLDDGMDRVASDDDMVIDRLADLLLDRMSAKLSQPSPRASNRTSRGYVH